MEIWDLYIAEDGNGGDFTLKGNDLATCSSIETAIYLAMFGGNVEASTVFPRTAGQQDFSYWGNSLFMGKSQAIQFNSLTERTLNTTPLNSGGRAIIENAIKKDLSFLGNVTVTVQIVSTDRINVTLRIVLPNGTPGVARFSMVRNPNTGDFDLLDFDFNDFL